MTIPKPIRSITTTEKRVSKDLPDEDMRRSCILWDGMKEAIPMADRSARTILRKLKKAYPEADCELHFKNPFQLAVAVILSAQTTDKQVNKVTPDLFHRFPTAARLSAAKPREVEALIHATGFYKNKTKSIIGFAQGLLDKHRGRVPKTLEALVRLPGVGRKTANAILGNAFGVPGITVDTHMQRLTRRLGFTRQSDPVAIERDLQKIFPKPQWTSLSHVIIWHGRRCCTARKPDCEHCPVQKECPRIGVPGVN